MTCEFPFGINKVNQIKSNQINKEKKKDKKELALYVKYILRLPDIQIAAHTVSNHMLTIIHTDGNHTDDRPYSQ